MECIEVFYVRGNKPLLLFMNKLFLVIVFALCCVFAFSMPHNGLDSIAIRKDKEEEARLQFSIHTLKESNPDSALYYLELLKKKHLKDKEWGNYIGEKRLTYAQILLLKNQPVKAIIQIETYINEIQKFNLNFDVNIFIELGNIYYKIKLYDNAIKSYKKALQYVNLNKINIYPVATNNIGMCWRKQGKFNEARKCFWRSYWYRNNELHDSILATYSLKLIAETYSMENKLREAKIIACQALNVWKQPVGIFSKQKKIHPLFRAEVMMELIKIYTKEKNIDSMLWFVNQTEKVIQENNLLKTAVTFPLLMAREWISLKLSKQASVSLAKYEHTNSKNKTYEEEYDYAYCKYKLALLNKQQFDAIKWKLKYYELKDSINNQSEVSDIVAFTIDVLESQNKMVLTEQKKQLLLNDEIIAKEKTIRKYVVAGLCMLFVGLLIVFIAYTKSTTDRKLIRKQNEEKGLLIKEIHHRVKNNLAVVSGILDLQQRDLKDPVLLETFRDAKSRINSIALVHKNLYEQENFALANVQAYFDNLYRIIFSTYKPREKNITHTINCGQTQMNIDTLIPLALITNELLTNTFKYAFTGIDKGAITIHLEQRVDGYVFTYTDNGVGLPVEVEKKEGLGFKLIKGLCSQLNGRLGIPKTTVGLTYVIEFKGIG